MSLKWIFDRVVSFLGLLFLWPVLLLVAILVKINMLGWPVFFVQKRVGKKNEYHPTWKPMRKQPVYAGAPVYTSGIEEELFTVGFCLPAGPYVTDEDVRNIVDCIKEAIE